MHVRILIVDGDRNTRSCMGLYLAREGYETESVSSGEEAIERLSQRNDIDMVLMDVGMPGMGGVEALRRMRAMGSGVPVILMRNYRYPDRVEGASTVLEKPIDPDRLLDEIRRGLPLEVQG